MSRDDKLGNTFNLNNSDANGMADFANKLDNNVSNVSSPHNIELEAKDVTHKQFKIDTDNLGLELPSANASASKSARFSHGVSKETQYVKIS